MEMARFSRLEVLNTMIEIGLVPVFYHKDPAVAKKIVASCVAGGARLVEFTNRGDLAYPVFCELVDHFTEADSTVILGVGRGIDQAVTQAATAAERVRGCICG